MLLLIKFENIFVVFWYKQEFRILRCLFYNTILKYELKLKKGKATTPHDVTSQVTHLSSQSQVDFITGTIKTQVWAWFGFSHCISAGAVRSDTPERQNRHQIKQRKRKHAVHFTSFVSSSCWFNSCCHELGKSKFVCCVFKRWKRHRFLSYPLPVISLENFDSPPPPTPSKM